MMKFWGRFWGPPCEHEWQQLSRIGVFAETDDKLPQKFIWLYRCKKCGTKKEYSSEQIGYLP